MLQTTIHDVVNTSWEKINPDCTTYLLYLVRDDETVFYIGQSYSPLDRLQSHMGLSWRGEQASKLGICIQENAPDSDNWHVELYTLADAAIYVEKYYGRALPIYDISIAEVSMIRVHRPCLNVTHNRDPLPLPAKYTHVRPNASSGQYLTV